MGIESTWDGTIDFDPPFLASLLKGSAYEAPRKDAFQFTLITKHDSEYIKDEDGWEIRKTRVRVTGIKPSYDQNFKGYDMRFQIQSFLDLIESRQGAVRCRGYIEKLTEIGELSRFYVRDGMVYEVEATISWPGWEDE